MQERLNEWVREKERVSGSEEKKEIECVFVVNVCMCVCERERERERGLEGMDMYTGVIHPFMARHAPESKPVWYERETIGYSTYN